MSKKLIYLAKRKPGFTPDDFTRRWRMHGARGMSVGFWRFALGYVQAEPIRPAPLPGASEEYDAIACYIVTDDMFAAPSAEDAAAGEMLLEDELETFSAPIPTVALWVSEEKLKVGDLGGTTAFLFFAGAGDARAVAECYRSDPRVTRLILNLRDDSFMGAMANTLPDAAVVEIAASGLADLKAVFGASAAEVFGRARVAVVTREAVFWDRISA